MPRRWPDERAERSAPWIGVLLVGVGLVAATGAASVLESLGVADASPVYLVVVVGVAGLSGTWPAIGTSILAFLVYDFLFTQPRFTLAVTDPAEWLSLLLFLLVAVAIGRLAALLRERADEAERRVRESVSLVGISRSIAMGTTFEQAAAEVCTRLHRDVELRGVRVTIQDAAGAETVVAQAGDIPDGGGDPWTLLRESGADASDWVRIVEGAAVDAVAAAGAGAGDVETYRIPIETAGENVGAITAVRVAGDPHPGRGARRILSLAADQLGVALLRDRLRDDVTTAEVARRGDALRGAILDSVSHDLRTPIATIRALAGSLADPDLDLADADRRGTAAAIDGEAERLAELVRSLLEMSRVQAGAIRPERAPYDPAELVETTTRRVERATGQPITVVLPADLPPVLADAVLLDVALGNVLDNALRYASVPAEVRVSASVAGPSLILAVDDAGPGVPPEAIPQLFERFYRVAPESDRARHGIGMGLAIAKGFVEAMGGTISAAPSDLGGLAIRITLPVAPEVAPEGDPAP